MLRYTSLRKLVTGAILSAAAFGIGATTSRASDSCAPACHYECVTVYVPKTIAYTKIVTLYDHCGRPYQVERTCYKTIQVPVTRRVLVCD